MEEELLKIYQLVNKYGQANEMILKIIEPGWIEYSMEIKEKHLATPFAAHGGAVAGLMDGVLGVAALSLTASERKLVSTIEFKINFLKPVFKGDQLVGTGKVLEKGKRIIIANGSIVAANRNNEKVAIATGTFNAYPFEKSGIAEYLQNIK
jgi:uncharacterized protein (TIGR00369 family)